jgi:muramoyltetrapeptide carboxypeptidase
MLMRLPPYLTPGDTVVVVSPSRHVFPEELKAFVQTMADGGLEVELGKYVYAAFHQQAGTDAQRLHDLQWALDHPTAAAIFASRGGYGLTRIIDQLDWTSFMVKPKWCVGFSDFTPMHLKLKALKIGSIHGIVPRLFGQDGNEQALATLYAALRGWPINIAWPVSDHQHDGLDIVAPIIGGNLAMIADSCGTSTQLETNDSILFLEDVGEAHYKIERMAMQLLRAGVLDGVKAIVLGQFSEMHDLASDFGCTVTQIFQRLLPSVPILDQFPAGHVPENRAITFGSLVRLMVINGIAQILPPDNPDA